MLTAVNPMSRSTSSRSIVPCRGRTSIARSPATGIRDTTSASRSGYRVGVPPPTYRDVNGPEKPGAYISISSFSAAKYESASSSRARTLLYGQNGQIHSQNGTWTYAPAGPSKERMTSDT